jgi:pimeloyl-ACP methyl ester carboxylesterase
VFVNSGTARIAFDSTLGDSHGQDVLLIHAGVTDRRSWTHLIKRLTPRHRCISYDQRGFGETEYQSESDWSPVADAVAVIDAVKARRPVIVACSMGGQHALDIALAHPDRVSGLVLIAPAVRGAPETPPKLDGPEATLYAAYLDADERGDVEELVRIDTHVWLDGPNSPEGRVGGEARALFMDMDRRAEESPDPGEAVEIMSAWDRLAQITVPTLILTGRLDATPLLARGPVLAQRIPNAEFRWLDGVAHLPHLEGDETTLAAISEFVDALPKRA